MHIFPHSHTDLGWLSPLEDYFYGKDLGIYQGSIESILTTVVKALEKDPERTFTYAEMKFFKMWWERQTSEKKASVRTLVKNG